MAIDTNRWIAMCRKWFAKVKVNMNYFANTCVGGILADISIMNKSAKIFLISSGIYLFLLTFLLLTQPKSGHSPTPGEALFYYLLFLPLWTLIAGMIFLSNKHNAKNWNQTAYAKRMLFWTIILLILVGFLFNFDYQKQVGCLVADELDFSFNKIILSLGSIIFLSAGYYLSSKKFGISLLIIEFILWTFKVLYYNSSLDLFLPGYFTMTCWTLRVILITKVLNKQVVDLRDIKTNHLQGV